MNSQKDKILIVGHYPPPYGGISSHIRDITERLSRKNFFINILTFEKKAKDEKLNNFSNLFRVRNKISAKLLLSSLINIKKVVKIFISLWSIKISTLHFFSALNRALIIYSYLKKLDINVVAIYGTRIGEIIPFLKILNPKINVCFTFFADPIKNKFFFIKNITFWRKVFSLSDKLATSSKFCSSGANIISKNLKTEVIYIGVDLNRFPIKNISFFIKKKLKKILFVGRMEEEMGIKAVVEIAKKTISFREDVIFNIIGASGLENNHVISASKKFIGKINYKFDVTDQELDYFINNCDILIAPTVGAHACMGVSAKEALAAGIPVVASDSGGLPEAITNNSEGFIVSLKNGEIDINEYCKFIDILCDEDKIRLEFGKKARLKAERLFSNDVTEKKVSSFFTFG
jgi:glycosyltransferase involved in cell wall biosynthesis